MTVPLAMLQAHTCRMCGSLIAPSMRALHNSVCPGRAAALAAVPATPPA